MAHINTNSYIDGTGTTIPPFLSVSGLKNKQTGDKKQHPGIKKTTGDKKTGD